MPLIDKIAENRTVFFHYVHVCNDKFPMGERFDSYMQIINMHRNNENIAVLLDGEEFYKRIYETLKLWDMDKRNARLEEFDIFRNSIINCKKNFIELYAYKLSNELDLQKLLPLLKRVFLNLNVMESKSRIVGVSKTLHFLLPDLVIPIDRKYTMEAFYGFNNKYCKDGNKEFETFCNIFKKAYEIAKELELTQNDVDKKKWNTSIPKLIDNAIIGVIKENNSNKIIDRQKRQKNSVPIDSPSAEDFKDTLLSMLDSAEKEGMAYRDVRAGDLHKKVGGYPGKNHRMPVCCDVMKKFMQKPDSIIKAPAKGHGANLIIRYKLPRKPIDFYPNTRPGYALLYLDGWRHKPNETIRYELITNEGDSIDVSEAQDRHVDKIAGVAFCNVTGEGFQMSVDMYPQFMSRIEAFLKKHPTLVYRNGLFKKSYLVIKNEKNQKSIEAHSGSADLKHSFENAWEYLNDKGKINLQSSTGTVFTACSNITRDNRQVITFSQKGKEYARTYSCCWGHYYNCNRTRFGMYAKALDEYLNWI